MLVGASPSSGGLYRVNDFLQSCLCVYLLVLLHIHLQGEELVTDRTVQFFSMISCFASSIEGPGTLGFFCEWTSTFVIIKFPDLEMGERVGGVEIAFVKLCFRRVASVGGGVDFDHVLRIKGCRSM